MSAVIESTERAPGLPAPKSDCQRMLDRITPDAVTETTLDCIASAAKYGSRDALRIHVEHAVRWAAIDAYYAGLQAARNAR